jgi:hypothetical protein
MKQLITAMAAVFFTCFAIETIAQDTKAPQAVAYNPSFSIGKAEYATKVLEIWKDWDDNQLDRHDYFADTITMWLPDGTAARGKAVNMEGAKKFRGSMTKSKSTIHACIPLHNSDGNDDAVCIWGTEEDTYADGKVETRDLHEVWWFNKDGKISMMRQWAAKFGNPQ